MAATIDFTSVTARTIAALDAKGLRPMVTRPYRGSVEVAFSGPLSTSPFGAVVVGAETGRILRASVTYGNAGRTVRITGAPAVAATIKAL